MMVLSHRHLTVERHDTTALAAASRVETSLNRALSLNGFTDRR
jgi:hypothetical protein